MSRPLPPLPILAALPALADALDAHRAVVLEAPPGAGKSTVVPLALLEAPWRRDERILVLEPRRIAARAVAARMAELLGEPLGERVGFRTRLESRVSAATRIEVVTEGILTRRLQQDAALEGVACVIFDEFHERSLQADLGLALVLDVQRNLREDLRLLVMSATLDGAALLRLLGEGATVVSAPGRMYPVETHYVPALAPGRGQYEARVEAQAVATLRRALVEQAAGDALVFLPGAAEIRRAAELLTAQPGDADLLVLPLYGELSAAAQDAALRPAPPGRRKLVLATNIAETSLTIDGVRIVVDGGLERRPRFDAATGMSGLETLRISQASAEQRRGRAGRTAPGVCYRLWSESQHAALLPQSPPEIFEADLAPLALELACWGSQSAATLSWLDPPPAASFAAARELLRALEALDTQGRVTPLGRRMATLGVHPRLAHMILRAESLGQGRLACEIAALLGERDMLRAADRRRDPDLRLRVDALRGDAAPPGFAIDRGGLQRVRRAVDQLQRRLDRERAAVSTPATIVEPCGLLLAFAYPDRIGRSREPGSGRYLLSGGRGAEFAEACALARAEFIVAASLDGVGRDARLQLAAPVALEDLERHFAASIERVSRVEWDTRSAAVVATMQRRLGELVLESRPWRDAPPADLLAAMLGGIRELGLASLPWTPALEEWRARVGFLHAQAAQGMQSWPEVSEPILLGTLETWLAPYLDGVTRREHLARVDLGSALRGLLDYRAQRQLDELAPTHLDVPSGSRVPVDYASGTPTLSVRLQEVFGWTESPRVAGGTVPVTMELLSPARRPVQLTRDLASFWQRGYVEVRKELRGRYPKHYWPEEPLTATATRRVRPPGAG